MRYERIVAPTDIPVSILAARLHLRDPEATENAEILSFIKTAVEMVEHKTGRALLTQTWEAYLRNFPRYCYDDPYIDLTPLPLQSVTSVKYLDSDAAEQTLATSEYEVIAGDKLGRIELAYGKSWPTTYTSGEVVTIRYVSGYSDVDLVPEGIVNWIKMAVETQDKHRGIALEKALTMSPFADGVLDRHKVGLGV